MSSCTSAEPGSARSLLLVALFVGLAMACSSGENEPPPITDATGGAGTGGAASGGAALLGGGTSLGGAPPVTGSGGVGLYSDVFESFAGAAGTGGGTVVACPETDPGVCDFTRSTGCCSALSCDHANGSNPWDPRPIEQCQLLLACVQANPGCSSAADPLCFGNETGPCTQQGYDASYENPDGPFAYTVKLMNCMCGY